MSDLPLYSLAIAGSTMTYVDVGEGHPVLLGPSYLQSAEMWRAQIEVLSRRYRVIVPNLWGQGGSGRMPAGTASLRDIAGHHLELADKLGVERFALVGLSVGGLWGGELALIAPDRLTALVLMSTSLDAEPEPAREGFNAMLDACAAAGRIPDSLFDVIVGVFFSPTVEDRAPHLPLALREALQAIEPATLVETNIPLGRLIFDRASRLGELHGLSVPTLVMTGTDDVSQPPATGRRTAEAIGAPFIEVPGAGHMLTLEAPEVINRHLVDFLQRTVPS